MMLRVLSRFLLVLLLAHSYSATAAMAADVPPSFADLIERLSPAVVNISTIQKAKAGNPTLQMQGLPPGKEYEPFREFFERFGDQFGQGVPPQGREVTSLGSGFVIDEDGYVVTNNHVVADADKVSVIFQDETSYDAKIVGRDAKTDLALLKIDSGKKLPFVRFGDSDDMRVGDWVIAIGNPFGLGGSVSAGIISARSRNINAGPFDDFIQTDAAINRGNSGGPLFNAQGEVIGVNSAIFSPSGGNIGIGFAIPTALAEPVLDQLKEFGRTHRGWLGVKIQHVSDEIAESVALDEARGALVLEVTPGSPAAGAGVEAGDVILSFNKKPIKQMRNLPRLVAETKVGTKVALTLWRKGRERTIDLTLGEMDEKSEQALNDSEAPKPSASNPRTETYLGLALAPITDGIRSEYQLDASVKGLIVLDVKTDSVGAGAGLRRQDVILDAHQQPVESVRELRRAIESARKAGRKNALLRVARGGQIQFITIATKD